MHMQMENEMERRKDIFFFVGGRVFYVFTTEMGEKQELGVEKVGDPTRLTLKYLFDLYVLRSAF